MGWSTNCNQARNERRRRQGRPDPDRSAETAKRKIKTKTMHDAGDGKVCSTDAVRGNGFIADIGASPADIMASGSRAVRLGQRTSASRRKAAGVSSAGGLRSHADFGKSCWQESWRSEFSLCGRIRMQTNRI